MPTVYGMSASGNCYKVRLVLAQLGMAHRWIEVDSAHGETRTPEFLARNPNGKVPLLELADGRRLAESNAILCFLAEGSGLLPADPWRRAQVLQWLFFEQYSHEPYVAVARFIAGWLPADHPRQAELPRLRDRGNERGVLADALHPDAAAPLGRLDQYREPEASRGRGDRLVCLLLRRVARHYRDPRL